MLFIILGTFLDFFLYIGSVTNEHSYLRLSALADYT